MYRFDMFVGLGLLRMKDGHCKTADFKLKVWRNMESDMVGILKGLYIPTLLCRIELSNLTTMRQYCLRKVVQPISDLA